jgi:hypothetical protein
VVLHAFDRRPKGEEIGPKSMTIPLLVGTKVRFRELYRPPQVRWGTIGTVLDMEERLSQPWVRARFGDFITPWIEAWQLERVN